MLRYAAAMAAFLLAGVPPIAAAPYDDAFAAYQKGDYKKALTLMRPLAEKGDTNAAMYERGLGVTQDYKEAAKWYRLAGDHGNAQAQYNVGVMYAGGRGLPQ